jgi:hypothetical protein
MPTHRPQGRQSFILSEHPDKAYRTETDCGIKHAADFEAHSQDTDAF